MPWDARTSSYYVSLLSSTSGVRVIRYRSLAHNVAERHHGRKQLIERMVNSTSGSKRRKMDVKTGHGGLALGYEVMEIRDDGDEGESDSLLMEVCS